MRISTLLCITAAFGVTHGLVVNERLLQVDPEMRGEIRAEPRPKRVVNYTAVSKDMAPPVDHSPPSFETLCAPFRSEAPCPNLKMIDKLPNMCDSWPDLCSTGATKMYKRCKLPQMPNAPHGNNTPSEDYKTWMKVLKKEQIVQELTEMSFSTFGQLKPTQTVIETCTVCRNVMRALKCESMRESITSLEGNRCEAHWNPVFPGCLCPWADGVISVSEDGNVLDGHHRWAATKLMMEAYDLHIPSEFKEDGRVKVNQFVKKGASKKGKSPGATGEVLLKVIKDNHDKLGGAIKHAKCS